MAPTTRVTLTPAQVRALFERQALLPVRDALGVIHEAQRAMQDEPNVARVRCPVGAGGDTTAAAAFGAHASRLRTLAAVSRLGSTCVQLLGTSTASSST